MDSVLKQLHQENQYTFFVTGSKSIKAFIPRSKVNDTEWDIVVIGPENVMISFIQSVSNLLNTEFSTVEHKGNNKAIDLFSFMANKWISVFINDKPTSYKRVMNVFYIPKVYPSIKQSVKIIDNIPYSDMGFLLLELTMTEHDIQKLIEYKEKIDEEELKNIMSQLKYISISLNMFNDNVETVFYEKELEKINDILKKISVIKDKLFGYILSGEADKSTVNNICQICRLLKEQKDLYSNIKNQCSVCK